MALLVTAIACDGARKPPFLPESSPTVTAHATAQATATAQPTLSPTPAATLANLDGFRQFAFHVEKAVKSRDADWFTSTATVASLVCPLNYPTQPICEGVPDGTLVRGVWTGLWRSEGMILPVDDFRISMQQYLRSLKTPALYAIAALDRYVGGSIGGPAVFAVVVSADDPSSTARVFEFVEYGPGWTMPLVIHVSNLATDWLSGECTDCYDRWERWEGTP